MLRRIIYVVLGLLPGSGHQANAQQPVRRVSLDDALALFATNNLELRIARAEASDATGQARQGAAYPNPVASVSHERLGRGATGDYRETYLNLTQRLDWPWLASARSSAAAQYGRAAAARLAADSIRLAFEVRRAFIDAAIFEDLAAAVEASAVTVRDAERQAVERAAAGDLSGYDRRRLRLERLRYEQEVGAAAAELHAARRRLAALVLPDTVAAIAPAGLPGGNVAGVTLEAALRLASAHPAMVEAQARREGTRRERGAARADRLPSPTLTAGHKSQSDGAGGAFLSAGFAIPFFDRRGAAASAATARAEAADARADLVVRQIDTDVRRSHEIFETVRRRAAFLGADARADADTLLGIARLSYREGETSLLELMDGLEAFRAGRAAVVRGQAAVWLAFYDLERAVGVPLSRAEEAR